MANITPNNLRGFLIPYIGIAKDALWTAQSTFSQANPRSGIPEAQNIGTGLVLSTIGTQEEKITVKTTEGGIPSEAQFTWSGVDTIEMGQDANHILTESGYWKFSSSAAVGSYFQSDCVSDLEGRVWVVSEVLDSGGRYTISIRRQEKNGAITALNTFVSVIPASTPNSNGLPCITRTQDGSLLVAFFTYTLDNDVNIQIHRSIDNGDNWTQISSRGLKTSIDSTTYTNKKMRMVTVDSTVVLFIETHSTTGALAQYVSRDNGSSFTLVDQISVNVEGDFHEPSPITLPDGSIGLSYINTAGGLEFTKIPNPGIRASSFEWMLNNKIDVDVSVGGQFADISSGIASNGNSCIFFQDGKIWIVAQKFGDGRLQLYVSEDLGATWAYGSSGSLFPNLADSIILDYGSNSDRLKQLSACVHEGRVKIFGHNTNSVWYLALNGYSSFGYPKRVDQPSRSQYMRWDSTYIPVMLPATSSQYTTTGAATQTLVEDGLRIQSANQTRKYRYTHLGSYFTTGQVIRARLKVDANSSNATDRIALRIFQDNTTNSRTLKFRFSTTQIVVQDSTGTKATITHDMTNSTEFVILFTDSDAKVFYRTADSKSAKKWTLQAITGINLDAPGTGNYVEWGHLALTADSLQSHWQEVSVSSGLEAGLFDSSLRGAQYPAYGEFIYIDGGLSITAKDSPARGEDTYIIESKFDYPIDNIFHSISLSPRVTWRSKDDTQNERIPLLMDKNVGSTIKSLGLSDTLGIYLGNINFENFIIESWDGGSWVTLAAVDVSDGLTGTYVLRGATLESNITENQFYLHYGEAIGWRAILTSGETKKIVKIIQNSEGVWGQNSDKKRCVLVYDTDLTDHSTIPASGTIKLIPNSITYLKSRLDGVNLGQRALAITIPTQTTLEGYYQIGSMVMGSVAYPAPQYQRGRTISYQPNNQDTETLDGMFFSRKMSDGRRVASVAWTEPIDTTKIQSRDPDYWQVTNTAGALPVANYGDAPFLMQGLYRYLQNRKPLVYIPVIKQVDDQLLNRYYDHLLARTTGSITIESVLGNELDNELFRVATINLEEIE